jgi:hypothetical protein
VLYRVFERLGVQPFHMEPSLERVDRTQEAFEIRIGAPVRTDKKPLRTSDDGFERHAASMPFVKGPRIDAVASVVA